ncbi:MAG TPA: hypothetical protein DDZ51_14500 [Planctomycetaceae bacterium]|nr:hypothetical protein [Planctomycetaceae bacterium]
MLKRITRRLAELMGYRISRIPEKSPPAEIEQMGWGVDPVADIATLVSDIESPLVFDVGAFHGEVALALRKKMPASRVFAFEPFPSSFKQLKSNTSHDPAIHVYEVGFADSAGHRKFSSNEHAPANSLLETDQRGHETWGQSVLNTTEQVEVTIDTIDRFVDSNDVECIDVLKLDCQGAEPLVISGASKALMDRKVRVIYAEIILQPTYVGQQSFHESLLMYNAAGFELFNIYNLSLTPDGVLRQIDAIFVRREE